MDNLTVFGCSWVGSVHCHCVGSSVRLVPHQNFMNRNQPAQVTKHYITCYIFTCFSFRPWRQQVGPLSSFQNVTIVSHRLNFPSFSTTWKSFFVGFHVLQLNNIPHNYFYYFFNFIYIFFANERCERVYYWAFVDWKTILLVLISLEINFRKVFIFPHYIPYSIV